MLSAVNYFPLQSACLERPKTGVRPAILAIRNYEIGIVGGHKQNRKNRRPDPGCLVP